MLGDEWIICLKLIQLILAVGDWLGNQVFFKSHKNKLYGMYKLIAFLIITANTAAFAQIITPESIGYKQLIYKYQSDSIPILVKSKRGEEHTPKPIFFFCQGSLPKPLIIYDGKDVFGVFPFNPDSLMEKFHLVIVGKPAIPLVAEVTSLQANYTYTDSTGNFPKKYCPALIVENKFLQFHTGI